MIRIVLKQPQKIPFSLFSISRKKKPFKAIKMKSATLCQLSFKSQLFIWKKISYLKNREQIWFLLTSLFSYGNVYSQLSILSYCRLRLFPKWRERDLWRYKCCLFGHWSFADHRLLICVYICNCFKHYLIDIIMYISLLSFNWIIFI